MRNEILLFFLCFPMVIFAQSERVISLTEALALSEQMDAVVAEKFEVQKAERDINIVYGNYRP